ncbi:hypothetical protein ACFX16_026979 [Malus domestica]
MQQEGMVEFIGLLKVKVIRGTNLAVRDMMTSDPNVILTLGKQVNNSSIFFFLGFAFTAMYAGLYVCLDKKAGSVAVLLCVLCWVQSPCLLAVLLTLQAQRIIKLWKSCRLRWTNYLRPDLKRGLLSELQLVSS